MGHRFVLWFHKAEPMQWDYGTAWELKGVPVDLYDLKTQVVLLNAVCLMRVYVAL